MLTKEEATIKASDYLCAQPAFKRAIIRGNPPTIWTDSTIEYPFGWLFYYDGKLFVETGDEDCSYMGNPPIFVDKYDGTINQDAFSIGIDEFPNFYKKLKNYE